MSGLDSLVDAKEKKEKVTKTPKPQTEPSKERGVGRPKASGCVPTSFRVHPEAKRQFDILAAELGRERFELVADALNLLFKEHGKKQIKVTRN